MFFEGISRRISRKFAKFLFFSLLPPIFFALLSCSGGGKSYSFEFPKISPDRSELKTEREKRSLPSNPSQGELRLYIDELILGPEKPRLEPILSLNSAVEFCFLREKTLYLGLSESSVLDLPNGSDVSERFSLLERNIRENFGEIDKILLFIGGKVVND